MNEANHNFHQRYDRSQDECSECIDEELARIAREEETDNQIEDAIEAQTHHHRG